jgi:hypothetical protein
MLNNLCLIFDVYYIEGENNYEHENSNVSQTSE